MGFMDSFTTDGTVEMKHNEYYNLMREAAKADLITNAVKAEVPGFYIQAMITGKKPECIAELEAEEENTGFHAEYEQITGAVVTIFEAWMKENGVESAAASLHRLIDTLAHNRIDELRTIKENREEHNAHMKEMFKEMMEAMEKMPVITASTRTVGVAKSADTISQTPGKMQRNPPRHVKNVRMAATSGEEKMQPGSRSRKARAWKNDSFV